MKTLILSTLAVLVTASGAFAQILSPTGNKPPTKPEDTEVYEPVPKVVKAGKTFEKPPSDAIILFDGKNLDEWVSARDKSAAKWKVEKGAFTVNKPSGDIQKKKKRGWGLGLSLSKRIVEQYHKGSITVKSSEAGKGTTFRIVLKK